MSRTKRIYNIDSSIGYYHPYQQVCMGRCSHCRDIKNKDTDVRRKRLKNEVRRDLTIETGVIG